MAWYWWILIVMLGLNAVAIALLGLMMAADYVAQRRMRGGSRRPREGEPGEE